MAGGSGESGVVVERRAFTLNGFLMLAVAVALALLGGWLVYRTVEAPSLAQGILAGLCLLLAGLSSSGFFPVQPNDSRVVLFLGHYIGTVRRSGFWWTNPFALRKRISLRVRNFNSEKLKVNDAMGNPIEIAAVVVWRVVDTAKALFDVDSYEEFVSIQSETAIRGLASRYPYDAPGEDVPSLRGSPEEIAATLKREVEERLDIAGVEVLEARLSHLAYAAEIAQAMLRRQQAQAIIAARRQIVEGAVGMVEMALQHLSEQKIVELDEERKATMVNNLLVVLTSEQESQPVLNTGTLYG